MRNLLIRDPHGLSTIPELDEHLGDQPDQPVDPPVESWTSDDVLLGMQMGNLIVAAVLGLLRDDR